MQSQKNEINCHMQWARTDNREATNNVIRTGYKPDQHTVQHTKTHSRTRRSIRRFNICQIKPPIVATETSNQTDGH